ncbi:GspE/PulE family protein [Endothiovibrio diazotrophicus]
MIDPASRHVPFPTVTHLRGVPHVLNRLKRLWGTLGFLEYVQELTVVERDRDGRAGFPPAVVAEIQRIRDVMIENLGDMGLNAAELDRAYAMPGVAPPPAPTAAPTPAPAPEEGTIEFDWPEDVATPQKSVTPSLKTVPPKAAPPAYRPPRLKIDGELAATPVSTTAELIRLTSSRSEPSKRRIGEMLVDEGIINSRQLDKALERKAKERNKRLGEIFVQMGVATEEEITIAVARKLAIPFITLKEMQANREALALIPQEIAEQQQVLPLALHEGVLIVAVAGLRHTSIVNDLRFVVRRPIKVVLIAGNELKSAIAAHYQLPEGAADVEVLEFDTSEFDSGPTEDSRSGNHHPSDADLAQQTPVVRLVDKIFHGAIRSRASDIHIRPEENTFEVIYRIDGALIHQSSAPKSALRALASRIKVLGKMDIAERRLPQDGRIRISLDQMTVDLRVSIMPSIKGESIVVRIVDQNAGIRPISSLGFSDDELESFNHLIHSSQGMLLVTGPTGSGKSSTLYASLAEIAKREPNIITVEDPVEQNVPGITQIQINTVPGYDAARALRNILRHDPDVIMIGEVRDQETLRLAAESSLTGHLVLSTLHTNDAVGTISRLVDMGTPPYLIASALIGVLSQRLVRLNCPHCLEPEEISPAIRRSLKVGDDEVFQRGRGCKYCNQLGFKGRHGVYELLTVDPKLRDLISRKASAEQLRQAALLSGMRPLTENALRLAREGRIPLAEVYRVRLE